MEQQEHKEQQENKDQQEQQEHKNDQADDQQYNQQKEITDSATETNKIIGTLIHKHTVNDIFDAFRWRIRWYKISKIAAALSYLFLALAMILSFTAGFMNIRILSYVAGIFDVIVLMLQKKESYAKQSSSNKTKIINNISKNMNVDVVISDLTDLDPINFNKILPL